MALNILKTTDYDQFKIKKGNRGVSKQMVRKLTNSISKNNLLSANPGIVNKEGYIIDGQHRLEACKILKIPFYYVIFDPASLTEIQLLNANMKVWSSLDFMESYIALGNKNYQIFKDFIEKYKFPFTMSRVMLEEPYALHLKRGNSDIFKSGKMQIPDLKKSIQIADEMAEWMEYAHESTKTSVRFYEAIFRMQKYHSEEKQALMLKLIETGKKIYRCESVRGYIRQFEDILNYKNNGKQIRL